MADVNRYRKLVQDLLLEYSKIRANNEEVEAEAIFDVERDRYQVVHVGWSHKRRVYGCILHLDIKAKFGFSTMEPKGALRLNWWITAFPNTT